MRAAETWLIPVRDQCYTCCIAELLDRNAEPDKTVQLGTALLTSLIDKFSKSQICLNDGFYYEHEETKYFFPLKLNLETVIKNLCGLSLQGNYEDQATTVCR
jgi:hypothetical protein